MNLDFDYTYADPINLSKEESATTNLNVGLNKDMFDFYRNKWLAETKYEADPEKIYGNKYYQHIIDFGHFFLPFIIEDLKENKNDWFFALESIS